MPEVTEMPPRGFYLAHEAGRLAGVSGPQIGQWARNGYIRSSQSVGPPRIYSFQDVAEAMVVHELRDRGADYRKIRNTIRDLRERYGSGWPLTHAQLATDKQGRIYTPADKVLYDIGQRGWQQLNVGPSELSWIAGLLRRGGWAARDLPDLQHIEVDPDRLSGRPTIRGRRVPAEKVAYLALHPDDEDELSAYSLSEDEINDAKRWWLAAAEFERAA